MSTSAALRPAGFPIDLWPLLLITLCLGNIPMAEAGSNPATAPGSKSVLASAPSSWQWRISSGPAYHSFGGLRFDGRSQSAALSIPSFTGGARAFHNPAGNSSSLVVRTYDDGFVDLDAGTVTDGTTWNWGYQSASQADGNSLSFHSRQASSTWDQSLSSSAVPSMMDDLEGWGPALQFEGTSPFQWGGFSPGFLTGLSWTPLANSFSFSDFALHQERRDFTSILTDHYDLQGITLPEAPYQGSFQGPGAIIDNKPASRSLRHLPDGGESALVLNSVTTAFDTDIFSLAAGPTLEKLWGPARFSLSTGFLVHVVLWDASQVESLSVTQGRSRTLLNQWNDHRSGTDFLRGAFVQATAGIWLDSRFTLSAFYRNEWAKDLALQAGPSRFTAEMDGYSIGLMLGRKF